jgi:hypothetical protein
MIENINLRKEEENLWYRKELLWIVLANSFLIWFSVNWRMSELQRKSMMFVEISSSIKVESDALWLNITWIVNCLIHMKKKSDIWIRESFHRIEFFLSNIYVKRKSWVDSTWTRTKHRFEKTLNHSIFDQTFWISTEIFKTSRSKTSFQLWSSRFRKMIRIISKNVCWIWNRLREHLQTWMKRVI